MFYIIYLTETIVYIILRVGAFDGILQNNEYVFLKRRYVFCSIYKEQEQYTADLLISIQ